MDNATTLTLEALKKGKQCLVFVNTRRGAEAQAERIAAKLEPGQPLLASKVLRVLPSPTKQCKRLARCVEKGVAFHHSGLHSEQRTLIEDSFKKGDVKVICATPTLAMGVDTPAYRVILRDLKRFGRRGLDWIPVLEYEQMSGRAGRPGFDDHGEAICIAKSEEEARFIVEKYLEGSPEVITSKLAVEPVLRTYVLSLAATGFASSVEELNDFFSKTFHAYQYRDDASLSVIIEKTVALLAEWEFLKRKDFLSANELSNDLEPTLLGRRVAELYLDPYTARYLLNCLRKASRNSPAFSWLHMASRCLEMRPLPSVRASEYESLREEVLPYLEDLFEPEPSEFDYEYGEFLKSLKAALLFNDWINEESEDSLLERRGVRPGELQAKLEVLDWLLYSSQELARISGFKELLSVLARLRERVKHGAKEELLPLLRLKHVGRVRARKLYNAGFKNLGLLGKASHHELVRILGEKLALKVEAQLAPKGL